MDKNNNMDDTFISDVGQKSAISTGNTEVMPVEEVKEKLNKKEEVLEDKPKEPKKEKEPKKGGKGLAIVLLVIGLIIGGVLGYFGPEYLGINKNNESKKTVKVKTTDKKEELKANGEFINNLITRYDLDNATVDTIDVDEYKTFFMNDKNKVTDMDQNYIKYIAGINAYRGLFDEQTFTSDKLHEAVIKLFGNDFTIDDGDIIYPYSDPEIVVMKYNKTNSYYNHTNSSNNVSIGTSDFEIKRHILKAEKDNNKLEINIVVAILDSTSDKVYKKLNEELKPEDEVEGVAVETFKIDEEYSKLNQYKYTFNYDNENDNYTLESINLVK